MGMSISDWDNVIKDRWGGTYEEVKANIEEDRQVFIRDLQIGVWSRDEEGRALVDGILERKANEDS